VPADDQQHKLEFEIDPRASSWIALRHFPTLHTNAVKVIVAGKPIRASRDSARWCIGAIEQLWRMRESKIEASERDEARQTFQLVIAIYKNISAEATVP